MRAWGSEPDEPQIEIDEFKDGFGGQWRVRLKLSDGSSIYGHGKTKLGALGQALMAWHAVQPKKD
jgi:hypothetical protein